MGINTTVATVSAGASYPAATYNANLAGLMNGIQAAAVSATPAFASGVTVGNGTVAQFARQIGKFWNVRGSLTFGSTTSITASAVLLFPALISSGYPLHTALEGGGIFWDNSAAVPYPLNMEVVSLVASSLGSLAFAVPSGGTVNATLPVVGAVNDILSWAYTMEAA